MTTTFRPKEVTVYGASDDLIEVEGDIREEFNALSDDDGGLLAFSDGTVLRIRYDQDGFWRINRLAKGSAEYRHTEATDIDDDYSDRATLSGDILWVVHGKTLAT